MKNSARCDTWCIAGMLAIAASIVLGGLVSFVVSGYALIFFGIVFVIGVIILGTGLVMRRSATKPGAS